jgi:DNA-directed RNA polymerase I, II, and III subunit RPABC1
MDDENETERLWKIRKTILQLCNDRGYLVTSDELEQTLDQFKQTYGDKPSQDEPSRNKLLVLVSHNDDATNQMYVFFPDDKKIGQKTIEAYVKKMEEEEITRAIIVVSDGLTPSAKKVFIFVFLFKLSQIILLYEKYEFAYFLQINDYDLRYSYICG